MYNYRTITLVSRNINCSTITADEFISAMFSDILEADEKYNDLYSAEYVQNIINGFERTMKAVRSHATLYAEHKWKTEKKRNEYIQKELKKTRENYNLNSYYYGLSFFDFDVNPGSLGISSNCILSIDELTFDKLRRCFENIKNNEYFKKAIGWTLTYEAQEGSYRSAFRPQIKLILDDETQKKMDKEAADLTTTVNKFYEGCTYYGD